MEPATCRARVALARRARRRRQHARRFVIAKEQGMVRLRFRSPLFSAKLAFTVSLAVSSPSPVSCVSSSSPLSSASSPSPPPSPQTVAAGLLSVLAGPRAAVRVPAGQKNKCHLTRTPYGRRFANKDINSYFAFLFELIVARGPSVGLPLSLYYLFHGHLFLASGTGRLGILNPGHPFLSGLVLSKLSAVTVDDLGKETFATGGDLDLVKKELYQTMKQHMQKKERQKKAKSGWQKEAEAGEKSYSSARERAARRQNHRATTMSTPACAFYHALLLRKQPWKASSVLQCSPDGSGSEPWRNFQRKAAVAWSPHPPRCLSQRSLFRPLHPPTSGRLSTLLPLLPLPCCSLVLPRSSYPVNSRRHTCFHQQCCMGGGPCQRLGTHCCQACRRNP